MSQHSFKHLRQLTLTGGSERVLNNLITSELSKITESPQWTAFCNAKGQVITTSWLSKIDSAYTLTCHETLTDILINHIQRHALRHQFTVKINESLLLPKSFSTIEDAIQQGYPIIAIELSEQFIPQMLGMQHHPDAINFEKGCYLGQEIVMRAEQLGQVKRTLNKGSIHQLPSEQDILNEQGKLSGKLINASNQAPYTFNMVTKNHEEALYLDGKKIELLS